MKKLIVILFVFFGFNYCVAQSYYNEKIEHNFYGETVFKTVNTRVESSDTMFTIYEKGCKPVKYMVISQKPLRTGTLDNCAELTEGVYGCSECYVCVDMNTWSNVKDTNIASVLTKYGWYMIEYRVITTEITCSPTYKMFIIRKMKNSSEESNVAYVKEL